MKNLPMLMILIFLSAYLVAKDYPYSCTGTLNCPSKCKPEGQVVTCYLSGTLPYPTTCSKTTTSTTLKCDVKDTKGNIISSSGTVKCKDCSGGTASDDDNSAGCDPVTISWFNDCDPFAL